MTTYYDCVLVTTSKALVTTSDALVPSSFLLSRMLNLKLVKLALPQRVMKKILKH